MFPWKGGGEGCEGCCGFTFFSFSCFGPLSCTLTWGVFVPKNFESPISKRGQENQLPSLVDLFDRCFSHTTGEGRQLWFFSLFGIFGR